MKELTLELQRISDDLEQVKSEMDERGTNMTNNKPVVRIKKVLCCCVGVAYLIIWAGYESMCIGMRIERVWMCA